ncbi:MAG TPA: CHAT domain-containing protein [Pseudonocardiaceae bacterium]|nr:CHAT domain-containing protein [Pseudonocardiaceae bacterium]
MLRLEVLDYAGPTRWRWRLTDAEGASLAEHSVELDDGEWQFDAFADLHHHLRANADPDRRLDHEAELVVQVGAWVGERVFGDVALELARARGPVRLQVPAEAADLAYRPWELAMVDGRPLIAYRVTFVVDVGQQTTRKADVGARLRMLAVFSVPSDDGALNLRKERYALARIVHQIGAIRGTGVQLRVLQYGASRERLRHALAEPEGWDVVHVSGHGLQAGLVLEDETGRQDVIGGDELADLLELGARRIKLITLSSGDTAAVTTTEQLRQLGLAPAKPIATVEAAGSMPPVAAELARRLDCAVLAMRYPVTDEFAVALAESFYQQVMGNGLTVAEAVPLAVAMLAGVRPTPETPPLSVATPALFGTRAVDLRLTPPHGRPLVFALERVRLAEFPPQPSRFVGRVGPMTRATTVLAARSGLPGVLLHGPAGAGKTACALELAYAHQESFPAMAWYSAPADGHDVLTALAECALALERQLPGLKLAARAHDRAAWQEVMPGLTEVLEHARVLIVLDNVESLLTETGEWRDERWAQLIAAVTAHQGVARVIITSRRRPAGLPETVFVEPIHGLSLAETVSLSRNLPALRTMLDVGGDAESRDLAIRTLAATQGHPMLVELAEGTAADPDVLRAGLVAAERVWQERDVPTQPFLAGEDTTASAEDYHAVLAAWIASTTAALGADAALLFDFLCCLDPADRIPEIIDTTWGRIWQGDGDAPATAAEARILVERGLLAVDTEGDTGIPLRYRMHPDIAEIGGTAAGVAFAGTVDRVVGDSWLATLRDARDRKVEEQLGEWVVRAARSAVPYLMRQDRWAELAAAADLALSRSHSPATAVPMLPMLAEAVAATRTTDEAPVVELIHAQALGIVDPARALSVWQRLMTAAADREDYPGAAAIAADLLHGYRDSGRWQEALELADTLADFSARAGVGPWTRLANDGGRLQVLYLQGNFQDVLDAVEQHRATMADLPTEPDATETVSPAQVRESILGLGVVAAHDLGRWVHALDLNAAVRKSQEDRGAADAEKAATSFNDYGPLLQLNRAKDAAEMLRECRDVFEAANDTLMLGNTLSALADADGKLGHIGRSVELEARALRLKYEVADPEAVSVSHHNLANYVLRNGGDAALVWAHRLAAALIRYQTGSSRLSSTVQAIGRLIGREDAAESPLTFDQVQQIVDNIQGVHFGTMFAHLPSRAPGGQEALDELMALVVRARNSAVQEAVDVWEPMLSALVVGQSPEGAQALNDLDEVLTELSTDQVWKELVAVLSRIRYGERSRSLAENLDEAGAAIANRALDGLAGTADIDPNAWRALTEQA